LVATLHDRQIRRLRALEDATGVDPNLTKPTDNIRSVAHQPTDFRVIAHRVDRREPVECCQLGQLDPSAVQERGDPDEDGIGALATHSFEGGIDLRTAVGVEDLDLQPNGASRHLHLFHLGLGDRHIGRIDEQGCGQPGEPVHATAPAASPPTRR
jgi:hypothetical protein